MRVVEYKTVIVFVNILAIFDFKFAREESEDI